MDNSELKAAVYNIENEKIIKEAEKLEDVENKLNECIIIDFENQQKVDDSILDETPPDVENNNMLILLNAA